MRRTRAGFAAVALFSFFFNLLMLVAPLYSLQVFDRVLTSGQLATLLMLTLIGGFALLVLAGLDMLRARVLGTVGKWLNRDLSGTVIASSIKASLANAPRGAQPLRDLSQLHSFIAGQGILPILDAPWMPIFVAILWLMHPWFGVLALFSAVALFGLALANEFTTRRLLTEANARQIEAYQFADAAIRNAEVIQAMGLLPGLVAHWNGLNDISIERQGVAANRSSTLLGISKFLRLFTQIAVMGTGAALVLAGELTPGGMIAASILLGRALAPVEQSIGAWRGFLAARSSYERLAALMAEEPVMPEGMDLPEPEGRLEVNDMSYMPPGSDRPVLNRLTFALEPGQCLAVIGPSAAGKSSLCRLLVGAWQPTLGHVRLDSAEVHSWNRQDFGRYVGYLPQDVELFGGSVRANIARMQDAEPEDVIEAAKLADVHDMILHLPNGYETEIGEGGVVLSGGQKQRLGLARALFGRPKFLVLDEPNANLDQAGEAALVRTLRELRERGTTIVLVAHRASVLSAVDMLMVLRAGAIEKFGPRDVVLAELQATRLPRPSERREPAAALERQTA